MLHVQTTCADPDSARALARAALDARLAACVTLTEGLVSLYHWQGAVAEDGEIGLTFKTTEALRDDLVALIAARHPYDLPVITWEVVGATLEAEAWAGDETR